LKDSPYKDVKFLQLTTYRKNGEMVTTPVWFIEREGKLFVRTGQKSWKAKRLQRDNRVAVAPASRPGNVTGPAVPGRARFLSEAEFREMDGWFKKRYGLQMKLVNLALWLGKVQACGIEIRLEAGDAPPNAKGGPP
jgi:PPOX class probable F420-dependent enzyme